MAQYAISSSGAKHQDVSIEFPRGNYPDHRPSVGGPQYSAYFDGGTETKKLPRPTKPSNAQINFLPPFLTILFGSTYLLTVVCVILILPILELAVGVAYQDKCPVESNIPKYLIVTGICGIIASAFTLVIIASIKCCNNQDSIFGSCISGCVIVSMIIFILLICLFLFAWFIAGNVWVFGARTKVDFSNENSANYCNSFLYNFSFSMIILTYVMVVFSCCLSCCRACCASVSSLKA